MDESAKPKTDTAERPDDNALARKWAKRLDRALRVRREDELEKKYKKLRAYVRGDVGDDGESGLVRTNIVHSNFAAILPQIYAKNPEIAVVPAESVDEPRYEWVGKLCRTMQIVLNRVFVTDGQLKPRAKGAVRSAMTTGVGWLKVSWQRDIRIDPIIQNRIADTQDNLLRINRLIDEIEEGDDGLSELEANRAELEQMLAALRQQAEVSAAEGIAIDKIQSEDVFILDDTLTDFDAYAQADAIAHRVWMTCDEYEAAFGKEPPKTASRYDGDRRERGNSVGDDLFPSLVAVFEVWDRNSNTVYTLCAGSKEWSRDPYVPEPSGERFFPFFGLAFNLTDGRMHPLSDTELLIELQDEYNTTRTNFAEHRKENLPVRVYRAAGNLTDADIKRLTNRRSNDWIPIEGDPNVPVENDIAILKNPPIDPATYDVQHILRDAEMVLGAGDASKGTINRAKTATEAEIMAMGLQSRMSERQDTIEDWVSEMAKYAGELCLQALSPQQVERIAGKGAVWPQMTKDQVFDMVQINIRAGSSGRPNHSREREQWVQMLPQIQQSVQQIVQLRQAGQHDMAETVLKLLEETLRRFDERIDIEAFIPSIRSDAQQPEQAAQIPPELVQQQQQIGAAVEQLQQENQLLKEKLAGRLEEARIKAEAEIQKALIAAQARHAAGHIGGMMNG